MRKEMPGTAGTKDVEDRVDHLAHVGGPGSPSPVSGRTKGAISSHCASVKSVA